jgi:hypothetical protein
MKYFDNYLCYFSIIIQLKFLPTPKLGLETSNLIHIFNESVCVSLCPAVSACGVYVHVFTFIYLLPPPPKLEKKKKREGGGGAGRGILT